MADYNITPDDLINAVSNIADEINMFAMSIQEQKKSIKLRLDLYDRKQDVYIRSFVGTYDDLKSQIPEYKNYYYRISKYGKIGVIGKCHTVHFNVNTSNENTLTFDMGSYLNNFLNRKLRSKTYKGVSLWYDTLVRYCWICRKLSEVDKRRNVFDSCFDTFLKNNSKFNEIFDLNDCADVAGVYIMVFDEYKTCYVGMSDNIRERIMRHWSRCDYYTGSGVDIFKPCDTTRIYVRKLKNRKKCCDIECDAIKALSEGSVFNILNGDLFYLLDKHIPLTVDTKSVNADTCTSSISVGVLRNQHEFIMTVADMFS